MLKAVVDTVTFTFTKGQCNINSNTWPVENATGSLPFSKFKRTGLTIFCASKCGAITFS